MQPKPTDSCPGYSLPAGPPPLGGIQPTPWKPQPFTPVSSQAYSEIQQFLNYEALLLDHSCLDQWSGLLAPDVTYSVCNCSGRDRGGPGVAEYVDRSREALLLRLGRLSPKPDSRLRLPMTRRFVTNVSVSFAHHNEYDVVSYLRVAHIGHEGTTNSAWSAERRDRLRGIDGSFTIIRRAVLVDSIEPGISELPLFL
jgi:3-phenylpropionate/cinnamic acid dioxygenase small subunit